MKFNVKSEKLITYFKFALIVLLVVIAAVVCAQAVIRYVNTEEFYKLLIVFACCFALAVAETLDSFIARKFAAKMVFYGVDAALLLVICILTGNSLLSTLYCVVLTQMYVNIPRFKDKLILFAVSCALFAVSFIVGWVLTNPAASMVDSAVSIFSGALFGLLAIALDFIVVQFLLSFYRTNIELSKALKEADDSRARLKEAYEQLSETLVYEERNRIAKDIHDNAGHSMTTVIVQTEAARLLIDKDPAEAKNRIISANLQARNALEQMRESVHLLAGRKKTRPLREELEEIIAQTVGGTEIKARCNFCDAQPGEEADRFLCNSLKECLANGIRHGGATAFYVELKAEDGFVTLYISDNGRGVDGEIRPGFGLNGIIEKAKSLGGGCTLASERDEGFEVKITVAQNPENGKPLNGRNLRKTENSQKPQNIGQSGKKEEK